MYHIMKKIMAVNLIIALTIGASGISTQAASNTKWKNLYDGYLKTIKNLKKIYPNGEFIYINHDNIPELYLEGYCNGAGNCLLTIYNNKVYKYELIQPGDLSYLKKQNRFLISYGRDDAYGEYVAKFSKGKIIGQAGGVFGFNVFGNGDVKLDKEGKIINQYYWNDKSKKGTNLYEYYRNPENGRKLTKSAYDKKRNQSLGKDRKKYKFASSKMTIRQIKKKLKM